MRPLIRFNYRNPFGVIAFALVTAAVAGYFAVQLKVDTDLANLLPKTNDHVIALERLQQTVGGETSMELAIQSPSFEANRAFANEFIQQALKLYDPATENYFFKRAEFRKDVEVLKDNALYFATDNELTDIADYLESEIHQAKEDANPFYMDLGLDEEGDEAAQQQNLERFEESYNDLIPDEYPMSPDSTVMVVHFYPTGSKSNLSFLRDMFASVDSLAAVMEPASYHPQMEVRYGGRLQRHLEEIDSIMNDVFRSFASGISTVILLVMFYFFIKKYIHYRRGGSRGQTHAVWSHLLRVPVPVLVIGLPLVISLSWTFGITYAVLGMLNTMTSVLFVILFGMGIDYGIHFYARYIEFRSDGLDIPDALQSTYDKTGMAIMVSGLTTALSLYVLVLARFRGFSEFGFIAGSGIILALLCMLFVLPSLLVICERFNWILLNVESVERRASGPRRFPMARTIVLSGLAVAVLVGIFSSNIRFQYDFGELEPDFPRYESFREITDRVNTSDKHNPAYLLADNQQEVIQILEKLRHRMRTDTTSPTIAEVEALPERFPPTDSAATAKLQRISDIRELLNDPVIQGQDDPQLDRLRRAAQTRTRMSIDDIPDYFRNQFVTREGEVGNFVIVYPSVGLADGRNSIAFKEDVGEVTLDSGKTFHAASTSIIAAEMLDLMRSESPWMVGATFTMVFLLMLIAFRSLRWTLIAMLPLVVGLLWLFGIMILTGMMFNFYNLVVLPAILGIGEDNGVHLAHRYRDEGRNSMWEVLSSTGQHVTIGSMTTMLGFSGLIFTTHPGLQSLGIMAVIGIGMTLVAALTFLPALIQWLEDRNWIRY
ncbi:MAG: MMPL family transporter [Balneolaceae bacterium]|nr:MMPL family transporter [Balneolaceae bacterium]